MAQCAGCFSHFSGDPIQVGGFLATRSALLCEASRREPADLIDAAIKACRGASEWKGILSW